MTCPLINKAKSKGLCRNCPYHSVFINDRETIEECMIEKFEDSPWKQVALIMRHLDFNEGVWR